jgi:poly-gamma-glutamate synthesis protein (capsule biosynthesis protein)
MTEKRQNIRLAVVGDLLLTTPYSATTPGRGMEALSAEIREIFSSCDLVFANLECTLPAEKLIATEPRVLTTERQLESLAAAHINLVTLGNNHAFDTFDEGFYKTTQKLDQLDIHAFGAGYNLKQASIPSVFTINGISIAFLAAVDRSSGMNSFATENSSGVPQLNSEIICTKIRELKLENDHVIFAPHWGEERFRFPSSQQIEQAHAFIDAGASLVLGHHPHVIQGTEHYKNGFIAYSLGNFLTNNVYWENGDILTWNRFERTSEIVLIELEGLQISNIQQLPTYDNGEEIVIEKSGWGDKCLKKADHYLEKGVTPADYQREAFRVRTLLPFKNQLRWENLRRIRGGHFKKALKLILQKKER